MKLMEQAVLLMKNLLLRHEERLEDFDEKFRQSREDFDFKMNALIDSQIKSEADTVALRGEIRELNLASRSQLNRIERLEVR